MKKDVFRSLPRKITQAGVLALPLIPGFAACATTNPSAQVPPVIELFQETEDLEMATQRENLETYLRHTNLDIPGYDGKTFEEILAARNLGFAVKSTPNRMGKVISLDGLVTYTIPFNQNGYAALLPAKDIWKQYGDQVGWGLEVIIPFPDRTEYWIAEDEYSGYQFSLKAVRNPHGIERFIEEYNPSFK